MSVKEPPILNFPGRSGSEDIDSLLSSYFQSEMPKDWPECPQPTQMKMPTPTSNRPQWHSRFALAASVALFLFASWMLMGTTGNLTDSNENGKLRVINPTANLPSDHPRHSGTIKIEESLNNDKSGTKFKMILEQDMP